MNVVRNALCIRSYRPACLSQHQDALVHQLSGMPTQYTRPARVLLSCHTSLYLPEIQDNEQEEEGEGIASVSNSLKAIWRRKCPAQHLSQLSPSS